MTGNAENSDGLVPFKDDNAASLKTDGQNVGEFYWFNYRLIQVNNNLAAIFLPIVVIVFAGVSPPASSSLICKKISRQFCLQA